MEEKHGQQCFPRLGRCFDIWYKPRRERRDTIQDNGGNFMFIPRKIPTELIPALMAGAVGQVVQVQPVFFMRDGEVDLFRDDTRLEFCMAAVQRLNCFNECKRVLLPEWFFVHLGGAADLDDRSNSGFCSGFPFELCISECGGGYCQGEDVDARWGATGWTFDEVRWIAYGGSQF